MTLSYVIGTLTTQCQICPGWPTKSTSRMFRPWPKYSGFTGEHGHFGFRSEPSKAVVRDPLGRAYDRTTHLAERSAMMQRWADYLDKLRDGADVIQLHKPHDLDDLLCGDQSLSREH